MIVTGENWSTQCRMIHHKSHMDCSGIELSELKTVQSPPGTITIAVTPAARWLSDHLWASGMLKVAQHTSFPSTCTFTFLHIATFEKSHIPPHTSAHKHGTRKDISILCHEGEHYEPYDVMYGHGKCSSTHSSHKVGIWTKIVANEFKTIITYKQLIVWTQSVTDNCM
jgi:hypothetical protein